MNSRAVTRSLTILTIRSALGGQHRQRHRAILLTAFLGIIRSNRLVRTEADLFDLIDRNTLIYREISLHGFNAAFTQADVVGLVTGVVGMTFQNENHIGV